LQLQYEEIGTCCISTQSNPTNKRSSKRPVKVYNCLIFSVSMVGTPITHQYPFGSLKYSLMRQSTSRTHEASGSVTIGCFCHLSPVRLTSASNIDNCWYHPVTPEIHMGSSAPYPYGVWVHHAPASTKVSYFCRPDVPSRQIDPHCSVNPVIPFLHLA